MARLHEPGAAVPGHRIDRPAPRVRRGTRGSPVDRSTRKWRFHRLAFNRSFHRQLLSAGGRTRSHSHWRAREVHVRRVDREHRCRARSESIPRRATVPVRGRDRRRRPFSARAESSRPSDVPTRRSGELSCNLKNLSMHADIVRAGIARGVPRPIQAISILTIIRAGRARVRLSTKRRMAAPRRRLDLAHP